MPRPILDESQIHPAVRPKVSDYKREIVEEVQRAARDNPVLVVGMAQNPWPRRVRKLLDEAKIPYTYLEYGSYLSEWRRRSALKMWTGWPTFPMVFIKGTFVGGYEDMSKLIASGEYEHLLNGS
jgi:monothiol glutaredoxin